MRIGSMPAILPGMHVKPFAAFAQDHFIALRICIDDSCGIRNVIWSRGHCPSYLFLCRVTGLCRYILRSLRFGTAHKPDSNY